MASGPGSHAAAAVGPRVVLRVGARLLRGGLAGWRQGSVAFSLCTTAHPYHARSANIKYLVPLFLKRRCDRTPGGDTGDRLLIHGLWPQWDDASGNRSAVGVDGEALASLYWPQYCDGGAGHDFSVCCEQQRGGGCHDSPASADVCQLPPPRGSAALSRDMPDYVNQVRALHVLSESFLSASYDVEGCMDGCMRG